MSNFYLLKIYVENQNLHRAYETHIMAHTKKVIEQGRYGDSGFDLLIPEEVTSQKTDGEPIKISMGVSCALFRSNSFEIEYPCAFYLYPRSSLYKAGLRLTNSVGIIDSGYRGHLAGFFDVVKDTSIPQYSRLLQICTPDLTPVYNIQLVNSIEELGVTKRGTGGFGSTGQ